MNNRYRISLLILILGGFALRLYRLGSESFWYDETVSVVLARKSVPDLVAHTAGDIHPPGYYLLLHFWAWLTQPTLDSGLEFLFAWPSLFFGLLLLPLLFVIGRKIHTVPIAILALLLAAINPFHLWYSQEVRMYTVGAALGLICLWSLLKYFSIEADEPPNLNSSARAKHLLGYIFAAAVGLYTLYYFAFTLIALNVFALATFFQQRLAENRFRYQKSGLWLAAQIAVILLWSPWLPVFWRQATDPPVPPWRAEWTWPQFGHDLLESFSALVAGQTTVDWSIPIFAAVGLVALVWYAFVSKAPGRLLLYYLLVPTCVIYLLTIFVTPLYHVRYLFTYAPIFMIVLAALFVWLGQKKRWVAITLCAVLISTNLIGLARFWQHPAYQADDHRGAVADLANRWRPSDLILVNAGWAYTVLETYWPAVHNDAGKDQTRSTPPSIAATERLLDVVDFGDRESFPDDGQTPLLVRTGSVNATENLGWGNPQSDFFAISTTETSAALSSLASCYRRLWHYRIYDTVSDPEGYIRNWLSTNGTLQSEQWISGRDFGQVQLFELPMEGTERDNATSCEPDFIPWQPVIFGDVLQLNNVAAPSVQKSSQILYVTLEWEPLPSLATEEMPLGMSLRLYASVETLDVENLVVQEDETPIPHTVSWLDASAATNAPIRHSLALPIPPQTPPGTYSLELIVYRSQDGTPLSLPERKNTVWGQRLQLNQVVLQP